MGKTVFMGRNTYESLPERPKNTSNSNYGATKALKWRTNVVVSQSMHQGEYTLEKHRGVYVTENLDILNKECPLLTSERFVIGGKTLYEQTINLCDMVYVSRIHKEFECDTFYPLEELNKFEKIDTIKFGAFNLEIYKKY